VHVKDLLATPPKMVYDPSGGREPPPLTGLDNVHDLFIRRWWFIPVSSRRYSPPWTGSNCFRMKTKQVRTFF